MIIIWPQLIDFNDTLLFFKSNTDKVGTSRDVISESTIIRTLNLKSEMCSSRVFNS